MPLRHICTRTNEKHLHKNLRARVRRTPSFGAGVHLSKENVFASKQVTSRSHTILFYESAMFCNTDLHTYATVVKTRGHDRFVSDGTSSAAQSDVASYTQLWFSMPKMFGFTFFRDNPRSPFSFWCHLALLTGIDDFLCTGSINNFTNFISQTNKYNVLFTTLDKISSKIFFRFKPNYYYQYRKEKEHRLSLPLQEFMNFFILFKTNLYLNVQF